MKFHYEGASILHQYDAIQNIIYINPKSDKTTSI
jgi:hypothetical protein